MARKQLVVDAPVEQGVEQVKQEVKPNGQVYEVQLDILPPMQFAASHEQAAIDQYFNFFGILSTECRINVKRL
jgi:hypothetical protein